MRIISEKVKFATLQIFRPSLSPPNRMESFSALDEINHEKEKKAKRWQKMYLLCPRNLIYFYFSFVAAVRLFHVAFIRLRACFLFSLNCATYFTDIHDSRFESYRRAPQNTEFARHPTLNVHDKTLQIKFNPQIDFSMIFNFPSSRQQQPKERTGNKAPFQKIN